MKIQEKINLHDLAQEVTSLRSFVIGIAGKDSEGEYCPEYVQKVLKVSREKTVGSFAGTDDFLSSSNE